MKAELVALPILALLSACQGSGAEFVLEPSEDAPAVVDYGVLDVISAEDWQKLGPQAAIDEYGLHETIGPPEPIHRGGGTFRFQGNGNHVCVLTDMELVFWGQSISPIQPTVNYQYSDNYNDDGDIDLFVGISAFYNGSPGVEMGDFNGVYTDSQGQKTTIAYNECKQEGAKTDFVDSHAGRATPEYCTLDTDQREGVEFTAAMQTFAVPLDDGKMDFVAAVVDLGPTTDPDNPPGCGDLVQGDIDECTYLGEKFQGDDEADEDYAITVVGLENAFCLDPQTEALARYCCEYDDDYPDLCGEPPDSSFCLQYENEKKKK
jgi:hypothetical protein